MRHDPIARLDARPTARYCLGCQETAERGEIEHEQREERPGRA